MFAGVLTKYGASNVNRFTASFGKALQSSGSDPFVGGVVSMEINGGWHANFIKKYSPKMNYIVAPMPVAGETRYGGSFVDGNTWMVPRGAKAPEAAMKFVAWFSQPARSAKIAEAVFNVTPLNEGLAQQNTAGNAAMALSVKMVSGKDNFGLPAVDPMLVIRRELESGFNKLTAGQVKPDEMLDTVSKAVDTAIAQGRF
jgi:ABC-type glycerol-3-phosphate transport system substrate-binding protein